MLGIQTQTPPHTYTLAQQALSPLSLFPNLWSLFSSIKLYWNTTTHIHLCIIGGYFCTATEPFGYLLSGLLEKEPVTGLNLDCNVICLRRADSSLLCQCLVPPSFLFHLGKIQECWPEWSRDDAELPSLRCAGSVQLFALLTLCLSHSVLHTLSLGCLLRFG